MTTPPSAPARRLSRPHVRLKTLAAAAMAIAGAAALAMAQAGPAAADPGVDYVAVGASTTQDLMDQFQLDLGGNLLGDYDSYNLVTGAVHETITPFKLGVGHCSYPPAGHYHRRPALHPPAGCAGQSLPELGDVLRGRHRPGGYHP